MYEPKITLKERDGYISIWVNMPNGEIYNIWDLERKDINKKVMKCIASSFTRGFEAVIMLINELTQTSCNDVSIANLPEINMKIEKEPTKKKIKKENKKGQI